MAVPTASQKADEMQDTALSEFGTAAAGMAAC